MKRQVFFCALLLTLPGFADSNPNSKTERSWITDVFLVSPENLDHIQKGSVLIEDGRIARVERSPKAKAPEGVKVSLEVEST